MELKALEQKAREVRTGIIAVSYTHLDVYKRQILRGMVVPNTVTKTLHTEKMFTPTLDDFTIEEYPMYATIPNQIRTIKSFGRPVILVDDLLHKGYRIQALDPIFKENDVVIRKMIRSEEHTSELQSQR